MNGCFFIAIMKQLENVTNSQIREWIDEYIHSERDRALLKRRLCDGICYEPLAEEFGLSVWQTKNIIYKAQEKLFASV